MDDLDALNDFLLSQVSAKKQGFTHDNKKNATTDWWTPQWVFDVLGMNFDLDPASPVGGVPWLPAARHIAPPDDGLSAPWEGSVWLNPPYGPDTEKWLQRMDAHKNGVALVFARTDTRWFHNHVVHADCLVLLKGRISFIDGYGVTEGQGAGAGSMLVGWGADAFNCMQNFHFTDKGYFITLEGNREALNYFADERANQDD